MVTTKTDKTVLLCGRGMTTTRNWTCVRVPVLITIMPCKLVNPHSGDRVKYWNIDKPLQSIYADWPSANGARPYIMCVISFMIFSWAVGPRLKPRQLLSLVLHGQGEVCVVSCVLTWQWGGNSIDRRRNALHMPDMRDGVQLRPHPGSRYIHSITRPCIGVPFISIVKDSHLIPETGNLSWVFKNNKEHLKRGVR